MSKFVIFLVFIICVSLSLSFLSSEYQKSYKETAERKNTEIYPFYELWVYIGGITIIVLALSTILSKFIEKS